MMFIPMQNIKSLRQKVRMSFETESMAEDFVSNNACQYGALYIRKFTFDWNQIEERIYNE